MNNKRKNIKKNKKQFKPKVKKNQKGGVKTNIKDLENKIASYLPVKDLVKYSKISKSHNKMLREQKNKMKKHIKETQKIIEDNIMNLINCHMNFIKQIINVPELLSNPSLKNQVEMEKEEILKYKKIYIKDFIGKNKKILSLIKNIEKIHSKYF